MRDDWAARLGEFYREVDGAVEGKGWRCRACGECCRFDVAGHRLYASGLERRYLLDTAVLPEKTAAGCEAETETEADLLARGLRCPYQAGGRCYARGGRPLGCRLYFCGAADDARVADFYEEWHRRLKALSDEIGAAWEYRPLLPL